MIQHCCIVLLAEPVGSYALPSYLQRLSGLGYCFSASLPPFLAATTIAAIDYLEDHLDLLPKLQQNVAVVRKGKAAAQNTTISIPAVVERYALPYRTMGVVRALDPGEAESSFRRAFE
jgi:7-keto-8-aminopelargonate synthetase-like enzyme